MVARALGAVVVLAIAGAAGGYAVSGFDTDAPATISVAAPVPAADPSYPVVEYDVEPDPDVAPLDGADLPLREVKMTEGQTRMAAEVPVGWDVNPTEPGANWNVVVSGNPDNTYILRITDLRMSSLTVARNFRMDALRDSQKNGNLDHLVFEEVGDDSFTATYLLDGFLRVARERFVDVGGLVASVSVVGREVDRSGITALQDRVLPTLHRR